VVSVHPTLSSCGRATVYLVISGTRGFWQDHRHLAQPSYQPLAPIIGFGWDASSHPTPPASLRPYLNSALAHTRLGVLVKRQTPAYLAFVPKTDAALYPGRYNSTDFSLDGFRPSVRLSEKAGYGVGVGAHIRGEKPLLLRFTADWLRPRAFGSCYVTLPSLPANGATDGLAFATYGIDQFQPVRGLQVNPATFGRTTLAVDGTFSLSDTAPTPTDLSPVFIPAENTLAFGDVSGFRAESPVWTCRLTPLNLSVGLGNGLPAPPAGAFSGNACGAVAVVSAPQADTIRQLALLVGGAVIGIIGTFWVTEIVKLVLAVRRKRP
jgi:hypothetical protein